MPITRACRRFRRSCRKQFPVVERWCATDASPYPRTWALKTLPFALFFPRCHLSAVTLLVPSVSVTVYKVSTCCYSLNCTPLHMEIHATSLLTLHGHVGAFKFIFPLLPFAPCLEQRLPKFGTCSTRPSARGRLFFSLFFVFFTLSAIGLPGIRRLFRFTGFLCYADVCLSFR